MTLQELMTRWNGYQIEMRRWFHQHPEESTKEVRTAERIRAELDRAGIPWRPCGLGTGTLARIEGAQPGRTILLRGDIDALSVNEETGLPYASEVPGVMHACGHDCHISMLLTAAMIVNEIRDRLKGTIVFAFQPAEELGLGARAMIEEGALEGVDACFGMHVWSDYPAGTVALRKGPMMASGDQFKIHVRGKSTHGAQPQLGADALIMGAAIAQNLQTIVSRETYPGDTAVGHPLQRRCGHRRTGGHDPHLQPRRARPLRGADHPHREEHGRSHARHGRCRIPAHRARHGQ